MDYYELYRVYRAPGWGLLLVVGGSLVLSVVGLFRLWNSRKRVVALVYCLGILCYPAGFPAIVSVPNRHLAKWIVIPYAALSPLWLLAGFVLLKHAKLSEDGENALQLVTVDNGPSRIRRLVGLALLLVSIVAWTYGATHPEIPKNAEIALLALFLYSAAIGSFWAATGSPLMDS